MSLRVPMAEHGVKDGAGGEVEQQPKQQRCEGGEETKDSSAGTKAVEEIENKANRLEERMPRVSSSLSLITARAAGAKWRHRAAAATAGVDTALPPPVVRDLHLAVSAVRYQAAGVSENLLRLLFELDSVPTHGDVHVRAARKAAVLRIQHLLEAADALKTRAFRVQDAITRIVGPLPTPPPSDADATHGAAEGDERVGSSGGEEEEEEEEEEEVPGSHAAADDAIDMEDDSDMEGGEEEEDDSDDSDDSADSEEDEQEGDEEDVVMDTCVAARPTTPPPHTAGAQPPSLPPRRRRQQATPGAAMKPPQRHRFSGDSGSDSEAHGSMDNGDEAHVGAAYDAYTRQRAAEMAAWRRWKAEEARAQAAAREVALAQYAARRRRQQEKMRQAEELMRRQAEYEEAQAQAQAAELERARALQRQRQQRQRRRQRQQLPAHEAFTLADLFGLTPTPQDKPATATARPATTPMLHRRRHFAGTCHHNPPRRRRHVAQRRHPMEPALFVGAPMSPFGATSLFW